jgi:hypothetical protein
MTALAAATPLPSPVAVVGVVSNDLPNRTLTVKLADAADGYTKLLWRESFAALRRSEQLGWRDSAPTVYASTDSADRVASATAGDAVFGGLLRFTFAPGEPSYVQLVGKPNLAAIVILDREQRRFLSCKFRHER